MSISRCWATCRAKWTGRQAISPLEATVSATAWKWGRVTATWRDKALRSLSAAVDRSGAAAVHRQDRLRQPAEEFDRQPFVRVRTRAAAQVGMVACGHAQQARGRTRAFRD
jgi:hypothetical protein